LADDMTRRRQTSTRFPKRVYTQSEVYEAKTLIDGGYKHRLHITGSQDFKTKVRKALKLAKTAGYHDFIRTYIRTIREIDGLSQLREAEASVWANLYTVEDSVDGACFIVQKAWQMKNYIEGKAYYGHIGETLAARECLKFLKELSRRTRNVEVREGCVRRMKIREDSIFL
jgi:hypothetical protein